jgi:ribosome-binding protein aMBF1 (putative translation factor)
MQNALPVFGDLLKQDMSFVAPRPISCAMACTSFGHGRGASISASCISFMAETLLSWCMRSPKRERSQRLILSVRTGEKVPSSKTQSGIRMKKNRKKKAMAKTKNALRILDRLTGDDAALKELIEVEAINAQVARMIYEARIQAGLTQEELARLVGTKQPVIARLEDADYEGHSLSMLQRIAMALHQRLEIHLVPDAR